MIANYTLADIRLAIRVSELPEYHKSKLLKKIDRFPPWDDLPASIKWNLCRAKLCRGAWDWLGWEYRSDWAKGLHEGKTPIPLWDGRRCKLLVIAEEGVGDEIMAASCFDDLFAKNPETVVECDARLVQVFRRSWGDRFVPRVTDWALREGDMILPMLDIFPIFRRSPADCPGVPYLKPDPERVEYWREVLPAKVGFAWKSRHGRIPVREFPCVSLQYGEAGAGYQPGIDPIVDFEDQINLIAALDLVVSCPMSVVHAAGALGVPVSVIMPPLGSGDVHNAMHWRYESGLPFYSNAKVYRGWEKSLLRSLPRDTNNMAAAS